MNDLCTRSSHGPSLSEAWTTLEMRIGCRANLNFTSFAVYVCRSLDIHGFTEIAIVSRMIILECMVLTLECMCMPNTTCNPCQPGFALGLHLTACSAKNLDIFTKTVRNPCLPLSPVVYRCLPLPPVVTHCPPSSPVVSRCLPSPPVVTRGLPNCNP